jgi:subtilase family serine protease
MHVFRRPRFKRGVRFRALVLIPAFLPVVCPDLCKAYGQSPNRISQIIDLTQTAPLKGSIVPLARPENDMGRMSADTRLRGVTVYFKLTPEQQADLDALVQAQQTPGSPSYHKWLTPAEYASRFGLSDSDLEKIRT